VQTADGVVAQARALGWEGTDGKLWDKARKPDVVQLCRNELPDEALPWIDAAVVLRQDDRGQPGLTYSRLLGTGGNLGRQDVSATYIQRAWAVLADPTRAGKSRRWLRAALLADESVPYERGPVGQFDPSRAGGVQSSVYENRTTTGSPTRGRSC
jgi:CRISPR-associated protein Csx17